jgi:hypothetical protein
MRSTRRWQLARSRKSAGHASVERHSTCEYEPRLVDPLLPSPPINRLSGRPVRRQYRLGSSDLHPVGLADTFEGDPRRRQLVSGRVAYPLAPLH